MEDKRLLYIGIGSAVFVLFSWIGTFLLTLLNFSPEKVLSFSFYQSLMQPTTLLVLLVGLFFIGSGMGVLFSFTRRLHKYAGLGMGLVGGTIGLLPIIVLQFSLFNLVIGAVYAIGVGFAAYSSSGKEVKGLLSRFSFGHRAAKRAFLIVAVSAFLFGFMHASMNPTLYEDTFKTEMMDFVGNQSAGMTFSKDQIKSMIESQVETQDFSVSKFQIKSLYGPLYQQMGKELTDAEVDVIHAQINTPQYMEMSKQAAYQNLDQSVDILHEKMNDPAYQQQAFANVDQIFESMPFFQTLLGTLKYLVAFVLSSMALTLSSLAAAPATGLVSLVLVSFIPEALPKNKVKALEELVKEKP